MKKVFLLLGAFWLTASIFALFAVAEVKYLGADWDTQGDWIGKYGKNGAIIFCNKEVHNADLPVPYEPSEKDKLFQPGLIEEINIVSSAGGAAYGWIFNADPGLTGCLVQAMAVRFTKGSLEFDPGIM